MADQQPVAPVAPTGEPQVTPPVPTPAPAENQPSATISFDSFSDDDKKYLAGQGITKQEELTSEALVKVINHARSSQKTAAERQAEIDKIKGVFTPPPADPFAPANPTAPTNPQEPGTPPTPAPAATGQGLDPVSAYNLSANLAGQFPELKDNLIDGSFFKDMNALGIPTTVGGQVNLNGILNYGKLAQERAQAQAKIEELSKPGEGAIPTPNGSGTPPAVADDAPMTAQIARAILLQDPNHARAAEAKTFLQK